MFMKLVFPTVPTVPERLQGLIGQCRGQVTAVGGACGHQTCPMRAGINRFEGTEVSHPVFETVSFRVRYRNRRGAGQNGVHAAAAGREHRAACRCVRSLLACSLSFLAASCFLTPAVTSLPRCGRQWRHRRTSLFLFLFTCLFKFKRAFSLIWTRSFSFSYMRECLQFKRPVVAVLH